MDYYAFGSNLDFGQMARRCPSAAFVCRALLPGHVLAFPRPSKNWGGGAASIVPGEGTGVWGVIYRLSETDGRALDGFEGFSAARPESENRYNRRPVEVFRDGRAGEPVQAWTYVAVPDGNAHRPARAYLAAILRGARHWQLPVDYIAGLEAIGAQDF